MSSLRTLLIGALAFIGTAGAAFACGECANPSTWHGASNSPVVAEAAPALSSRPGAAYTMYLNFDGFNYTGAWGYTGRSPGIVPAYTGSAAQIT